MLTYDDYRRSSRVAAQDADLWDKMASEAEARAIHYRQKADQRRSQAAEYAALASAESARINAEFADILGEAA